MSKKPEAGLNISGCLIFRFLLAVYNF